MRQCNTAMRQCNAAMRQCNTAMRQCAIQSSIAIVNYLTQPHCIDCTSCSFSRPFSMIQGLRIFVENSNLPGILQHEMEATLCLLAAAKQTNKHNNVIMSPPPNKKKSFTILLREILRYLVCHVLFPCLRCVNSGNI